jgi:hypothetical protein
MFVAFYLNKKKTEIITSAEFFVLTAHVSSPLLMPTHSHTRGMCESGASV